MHQDQMSVHQQTVMEDWLAPGNLKNIFLQISDKCIYKCELNCFDDKVKYISLGKERKCPFRRGVVPPHRHPLISLSLCGE